MQTEPASANAETERNSIAERERALRERLRVTSQLVAGILHEFNNPLGALRSTIDTTRNGVARALARFDADPERARHTLQQLDDVLAIARRAADRIVDTIETLNHFARVDRADVDTVEIGQVVDTALRLSGALRTGRIEIVRDFDPALRVRCRVREIEHVLYHLIRNANDALQQSAAPRIAIGAARFGDAVTVSIRDNGPGIDPAEVPTLFEPTLTTKGGTVGLGMSLATCRFIAQEHGGSMQGTNPPDGGALFTFVFREVPAHGA